MCSYIQELERLIRQNETIKRLCKSHHREKMEIVELFQQFLIQVYPNLVTVFNKYQNKQTLSEQLEIYKNHINIQRVELLHFLYENHIEVNQIVVEFNKRIITYQMIKDAVKKLKKQSQSLLRQKQTQIMKIIQDLKLLSQKHEQKRVLLTEAQLFIQKLQIETNDLRFQIEKQKTEYQLLSISYQKCLRNEQKWKTRYEVLQQQFHSLQSNYNDMILRGIENSNNNNQHHYHH